MKHIHDHLNRLLIQRGAGWVLIGALALIYVTAYRSHPLFPGSGEVASNRGWWTWTDQQRYLSESRAIAHGVLDRGTFHYPVGYPALGSLFVRWLPSHPFLVPDLLLVLAAACFWWRLALRWLSATEAFLVGVFFLVTHRALIGLTMVVPWNTIATQCALLAGIWMTLAGAGGRRIAWLAILGALTYLVRPIDALTFVPLLVFAIWKLGSWQARAVGAFSSATVLGAVAAGTMALNVAIFGSWRSPYETVSLQTVGFFSYPVSFKIFWLFVDGQPFFAETEPALLWRYSWLFLVAPAAAFAIAKESTAGLVVVTAIGFNALLYLNYNDLLPSDLYRFTLIHYLTWWFPLGFLLVAAAIRHAVKHPWVLGSFVIAMAGFVLAATVRLHFNPRVVVARVDGSYALPDSRPLLIRFPGTAAETITDLRLNGHSLVEYSEYLTPYVTSDLQLLLGTRTNGSELALVPNSKITVSPEIGEFIWAWHLTPNRLKALIQ